MILLGRKRVPVMAGKKRVNALHSALIDIHENKIQGDFVECGVWKGGNVIIAKKALDSVNDTQRKYYCYDTFSGMTEPGENDPERAHETWKTTSNCFSTLDEVKENFRIQDVLDDRVIFVQGDIRNTLLDKKNLPTDISILRLDTDWYDSTLIELEVLFPLLKNNGWLIIDDYGCWKGCKKAVDEYFGEKFVEENFTKLDYTGLAWKKV